MVQGVSRIGTAFGYDIKPHAQTQTDRHRHTDTGTHTHVNVIPRAKNYRDSKVVYISMYNIIYHVFKPVMGGRKAANLWDRQTKICMKQLAFSMGGTLGIALKGSKTGRPARLLPWIPGEIPDRRLFYTDIHH
jgi:hypothetical protein